MQAVELENISKTFGNHLAVDRLSLTVPSGSVYGFIGPNGSGKTTTLRMIMRIYMPDSGSGPIRVLGEEHHAASNDRIGYLPEERGLYRKMSVRDVLRFYADLRSPGDHREDIQRWLVQLGLADWADKKVQALSKGMAQKVQFIAAVVARPSLVILDEPFSGLDPVNAEVLKDAVLQLKREGVTVIFSTHDMDVAEKMCDFIFMIFKGRKVLDGTLDEIKGTFGSDTVRVRMQGDLGLPSSLVGVERINDYGRFQELKLLEGTDSQEVLSSVMCLGPVQHFEVSQPSLHDIFVRIARPNGQENGDA